MPNAYEYSLSFKVVELYDREDDLYDVRVTQ